MTKSAKSVRNKIAIISSLLFLVVLVSMSSITSNVLAAEPQFNNPTFIGVNPSNRVFVSDSHNDRIQKFSKTGTFIRKWGTPGTGDGQFDIPIGVGVDSSGNVFVGDSGNNRIQKFTNTGTFITKWGTFGTMSVSSVMVPFG